jgi:hypothetical protein
MEVLEPQAPDSYFSWNFFDPILGQKEGISSYHFEDIAATYLKEHPELRKKLEDRKAKDSVFAGNGAAQLDFVFRNSIYYEPAHLRYPIYRLVKSEELKFSKAEYFDCVGLLFTLHYSLSKPFLRFCGLLLFTRHEHGRKLIATAQYQLCCFLYILCG